MDPKKAALLAGAAIVALGSGFMAMTLFRGNSAPKVVAAIMPRQDNGPEILIATKPLAVGTIIDPTSFRFQPWPKSLIDNAYYLKGKFDMAKLSGTVVRSTIAVGQPITAGSLVSPGDRGFLAAALGPGMRAVTFPVAGVNGSQGVAGFVFPGDRVDLVLTQSISGGAGQALKTSETIIRNLRVLATDQHSSQAVDDKGARTIVPFTNVTVESTPRIAEKITVAQTLGTLSLALRSIADNQADLERAIATGDVHLPKDDPAGERRIITEFASRPIDNQVSFVTGGDVSHFQRKSVPVEKIPPSESDPNPTQPKARPLRSGGNAPATAPGVEPLHVDSARALPVVHVSRGNTVTDVQLGSGTRGQLNAQDEIKDGFSKLFGGAASSPGAQNSGGR